MPEKWSYSGDWITSCNCDYGCPCNFNAYPSKGHCEGITALNIREGKHGKTSLSGRKLVSVVWWPGAIHEGDGIARHYIDDKASNAQVAALEAIVRGQEGGKPWGILAKTISTVLPTKRAPIQMRVKGKDTVVKVGDYVDVAAEPILNPVTKEEHRADVTIHTYLIFNKGSLFSNKVHTVRDPEQPKLGWSHAGQYLATAKVRHKGP